MNYIIKDIQGSKMCLFDDDIGLSADLIKNGIREPGATEYIRSILKPDWIVIEAGANLGYYAFIEAQVVKKVYAIEPIKKNINSLNKAIEINGFTNIKTYQLAVGDENKKAYINKSTLSNINTLSNIDNMKDEYKTFWEKWHGDGVQETEVITIDDFIVRENIDKVDLIRMDVEGYETEVIMGMQKTLHNMKIGSYLFIEFHPVFFKDTSKMVYAVDSIIQAGFRAIKVFSGNGEIIDKDIISIIKESEFAPEVIFIK